MSVAPFAWAWKKTGLPPACTVWLFGVTRTEVTPVRATVTVVVPVQAEQLPALPVIVAEPMTSPVANPPVDTETEFGSLEDQTTPEFRVFWVPSLYVPVADI
jgi:hypothetical protein